MKIAHAQSKAHHHTELHQGKHEAGFEELLKVKAVQVASSTPAKAVTPLPASGHPPPAGGKGNHVVVLAPLPKVGSHVVIDKEKPKDKRIEKHASPPAHVAPAQLEQQLAKADVEPPKPAAAPVQHSAPVSNAAPVPAAAPEVKAILAPPPVLPIDPALAAQDSLRVLLMPHAAKVSVETAEAGRLDVRVDIKDGVAHVRATGEAAPLVDARTAELRVALAQEGLALGNFELGQQHRRPDDPERPSDASGFRRAQPAAKPAREDEKTLDGGLHIHA